ncbi:tetratricopeptide repeat-containing protein [Saccharomonospora viridis]|uniref:Tetratricopeptide repeat-containing protein n=1 Tax=Saccharomonospora viridis TaxID=1852 RepID=A0A837DGN7_9PSEU|nr:tetratricopeptide repeat-containing protein [Saccharomonospora viridis]
MTNDDGDTPFVAQHHTFPGLELHVFIQHETELAARLVSRGPDIADGPQGDGGPVARGRFGAKG